MQTRRARLWTIPGAAETLRSLPPSGDPRPSGPFQLPTTSLVLCPTSIPPSPQVSPLACSLLPLPSAVTPFLGGPPSHRVPPPGLRDLLGSWGSSGRALETLGFRSRDVRAQDTCPGNGSGWAGACSTSDTRGREGGERERECVSSSPPLRKTSESSLLLSHSSLSCSVTASRSPSPGYHRGSSKLPSPAEPVPGLSPPPGPG